MNFLKVLWSDITGIFKNRLIRASIIAIILLPLIYGGLYLAAFWDPYGLTQKLPIAVVNLDNGGIMDDSKVNYGKDIVDKLKTNTDLGWKFVKTSKEAEEGLKGDKYYAMVVIPKDFSQNILDVEKGKLVKPKLIFKGNKKKNYVVGLICDKAATALKTDVSKKIMGSFTDKVFDNMYDIRDGMVAAADGTAQMKDGVTDLKDKVPTMEDALQKLYDGSATMNDKIGDAHDGSNKLKDGIGSLKDKMPELVDGANELHKATGKLNTNMKDAYDGSITLRTGVADLNDKLPDLSDGMDSLYDATGMLKEGLGEVDDNMPKLIDGVGDLKDGAKKLNDGLKQLKDNVSKITGSVGEIGGNIQPRKRDIVTNFVNNTASENDLAIAQGIITNPIFKAATGLTDDDIKGLNAMLEAFKNFSSLRGNVGSMGDEQIDGVANKISAFSKSMAGNKELQGKLEALKGNFSDPQKVIAMLKQMLGIDDKTAIVYATAMNNVFQSIPKCMDQMTLLTIENQVGSEESKQGMSDLVGGIDKLYNGSKELYDGVGELYDKAIDLQNGTELLYNGSRNLNDGVDLVRGNIPMVTNGVSKMFDGTTELSDGLFKLNKGTETLDDKVGELAQKVPDMQEGTNELYDGSTDLSDGLFKLVDGSGKLKDGLNTLKGKIPDLKDGVNKLYEGVAELNSKLSDGAEEISDKLVARSKAIGSYISEPINLNDKPLFEVDKYGEGLAPYFISLALWVGALMMFFVITDEVSREVKAGPVSIVLGKYLSYSAIGVVQGILISIAVLKLGLRPSNIPVYFGFNIFLSLVFIAIMQNFIFLFGDVGRLLAVILLLLQLTSSGGTFPTELIPEFFRRLNPFMPFTYSIQAMREINSGINYNILYKDIAILLGIMFAFLTFSVLLKRHTDKIKDKLQLEKQREESLKE